MTEFRPNLRSNIEGITWPAALEGDAAIFALTELLKDTQWLPEEEIRAGQHQQLRCLAEHAARHSRAFSTRLKKSGLTPAALAAPGGLLRLPPMTRADLQSCGDDLFCREIPKAHAPWAEIRTSGSTGRPVRIRRTALTQHFWVAFTMRDHDWHARDFRVSLGAIRSAPDEGPEMPEESAHQSWNLPVSLFHESGPAFVSLATRPISLQAQWLARVNPGSLLVYPSILSSLIDELKLQALQVPALREIRTVGETLSPFLRNRAAQELGARVIDQYSADETGPIALQCPETGLYHTMAESMIVEILNEDNRPCAPGETGRVIVTDLHNFATPLIRYDIGDNAEVHAACPCGRGLPTLKRILGRTRNMMRTGEGPRWLTIDFHKLTDLAPIRQYQIIQLSLTDFELHLAVAAPLTAAQEKLVKEKMKEWIGSADTSSTQNIALVYHHDRIPLSSRGKLEEFICKCLP